MLTQVVLGLVTATDKSFDSGAIDTDGTFSHQFTTPGDNGTGTNDWVLVLDEGDAPCGRIGTVGLYVAPSTIPAGVECQVVATLEADPSVVAHAAVNLHY